MTCPGETSQEPPGMEQGETRVVSAKSSEAKRAFMPQHLN